ncbi:S-type pyocin domain-containing protein [Pseudomonas sp. McL0111]|uniref:S-type pyocin domain-containing protein n=1 Tax=Pseudomonas sp. McL0111 TaxID=3457357 RepID=UPI00403EB184
MQRPPQLELNEPVWTTAPAPPGFKPTSPTIDNNRYNGRFGTPLNTSRYQQVLQNFTGPLETEYEARAARIPQTIESDLVATRLEEPTHALPPAAAIVRELDVRNKVIQRKTAEQQRQITLSHQFYGSDPTDKTVYQFLSRAQVVDKVLSPNGPGMNVWKQSYRAALEARLLAQTLSVLHQQQANIHNWLASVQANDRTQAAAAEAQRLEAERARIVSEQQRQKDIANAQRREQEQSRIQEQARLAALAEAQRLALEQARSAAETSARQMAEEQARLDALIDAQRLLEEAREQAEQQERDQQSAASEVHHVFPASGMAASGPAFSLTSTAIVLSPERIAAIQTALRSAVQVVTTASAAAMGSVLVGFTALLMPSRLGNGERFAMTVPLAELASEDTQTLREIADRQGSVDLPVGLGYRSIGAGAEVFAVSTDGFDLRSDVPVLHATYNQLNDIYETALPDSPTDFLTWTPAVSPGNSSTDLPIVGTGTPAYSGAPIVPVEGRLDLHPVVVKGWQNFIIVFPDDSGIAPLYVVFSSPYDGASAKGKYSGRIFNPEKAGGPILDLDWRTAVITQAGIDAVKLHIARLDQSDANDIMVQRLEKILNRTWEVSDTDLRYYTHELRELERFRVLGLSDEFKPDRESPLWNNAHTATMEDYKLQDEETLLYTEDAIAAANKQDEVFYKKLLKGGTQ